MERLRESKITFGAKVDRFPARGVALNARRLSCCVGTFLFLLALPFAKAQVGQQEQASGSQPRQRIVRLSYVEGSVHILRGDSTEFSQAYQNMPLIEGSRVETGDDGRAEFEFEDGSLVRMAPDSSASLDQLVRQNGVYISAVRLTGGLSYLELRASRRYSYLITYPDGNFSPVQNSTVRVNLDVQPADLAVLDGDIRVEKQDAYNVEVRQGESMDVDPGDPSRYFLSQTIAPDSWDSWNDDRDAALLAQAADTTNARDQYAGDVGYGWSDLDAYGNWYPVPGYGLMWQPSNYGDNFDPYGNGVWAQYPNYGYVWVSGYPWGWTPFQCGSWNYAGGFGWGWSPTVGCGSYAGGWGSGFYGGFRGDRDGEEDRDRDGYRDRDRGRHNNVNGHPNGYTPPRRPILIAGHEEDGNGNITLGGPPKIVPVGRAGVRPGAAPVRVDGVTPTRQPVVYQGRDIAPLKSVATPLVRTTGVRSGLVRDYPVNAGSGKPELGVVPVPSNAGDGSQPGSSTVLASQSPYQSSGSPVINRGYTPNGGYANGRSQTPPRTVYQPRNAPVPVDRSSQEYPSAARPVYSAPSRPGMGQGVYTPQPRPSMPEQRQSVPVPSRPSPPPAAPRPSPAPAPSNPH